MLPLLKAAHLKCRLHVVQKFVDEPNTFWHNILWSDEIKIVQFDTGLDKQYFRRPPKQVFSTKFTCKTFKREGVRLMLWGCFLWNGVGPLVKIIGNMDASYYISNILEAVMVPYAEEDMPIRWVFQQNNGPKHTSKKA